MSRGNKSKFWNKKREQQLKELWFKKSLREIAKILGVRSRSSIYSTARRIGLPKKGGNSVWNPEMVQTLTRLFNDGYAAPSIQRYLGGKPSLSSINDKIVELRLREGRSGLVNFYRNCENQIYRRLREREKPSTEAVEASHRIDPNRPIIGLLELDADTCKFPFGEPGKPGFGFCGKPAMRAKSWCPDCHAVVVRGVVDLQIPERVNEVQAN
jgi:hypothetical protein